MMLIYVAHPVSGDVPANLARAKRWFRWLILSHPEHAFVMSWAPYVEVLSDSTPEQRERGLRDDLAVLRRMDGIVLCGGELTSGMEQELEVARNERLLVYNLLGLGREPPEDVVPVIGDDAWLLQASVVSGLGLTESEIAEMRARRRWRK